MAITVGRGRPAGGASVPCFRVKSRTPTPTPVAAPTVLPVVTAAVTVPLTAAVTVPLTAAVTVASAGPDDFLPGVVGAVGALAGRARRLGECVLLIWMEHSDMTNGKPGIVRYC
jgi:hypothetical protein